MPDTDPPSPPANVPVPGPLGRLVRKARAAAALLLECGIGLAVAAWLLGRLVSDRTLWTQYLGWMPTEAVLAGCVLLLAGAAIVRWHRPRAATTAVVLLLGAWLALGEWHLHRLILPGWEPSGPRVVFMNISYSSGSASIEPVFDAGGDIVILSNVHPQPISFERIYGVPQASLMERSIGIVPGESPPGEVHFVRYGMFHVFSKYPVRRRAAAHIGEQDSWLEDDVGGGGGVLMLEIETPDGPMIVWAVDMPSTIGASRRAMFAEMGRKIAAVDRASRVDSIGRWANDELASDDPMRMPDLVVGDFNTPSHAWSVGLLAPGMRNARADAGVGPPHTFHARFPIFEIDFALLDHETRVAGLERLRCEGCRHLGLVLDLGTRD